MPVWLSSQHHAPALPRAVFSRACHIVDRHLTRSNQTNPSVILLIRSSFISFIIYEYCFTIPSSLPCPLPHSDLPNLTRPVPCVNSCLARTALPYHSWWIARATNPSPTNSGAWLTTLPVQNFKGKAFMPGFYTGYPFSHQLHYQAPVASRLSETAVGLSVSNQACHHSLLCHLNQPNYTQTTANNHKPILQPRNLAPSHLLSSRLPVILITVRSVPHPASPS